MAKRFVYSFSEIEQAIEATGNETNVNQLLGEKGANLALIARLDIPVPKGFTISTEACRDFYKQNPPSFPPGMWEETLSALHKLEEETGKKFGDSENPLIVSCRSGAPVNVDGLLPTVLNLGLNDETAIAMVALTNNAKFVWDNYRRLIHGYSVTVLGISNEVFDFALEQLMKDKKRETEDEIIPEEWQSLVGMYKKIVESESGTAFPQDPFEQIRGATAAVFNSWGTRQAADFRRNERIDDDSGTAANIITMVFGNTGERSCTGYAFTRNPDTGDAKMTGEFLINAIGDELKKRVHEPNNITELDGLLPEPAALFNEISKKLEQHFKDMQHIEFTIENNHLWILQTMSGKRTATASVKIATDMVTEGLFSKEDALLRVNSDDVSKLIQPHFEESELSSLTEDKLFGVGVPSMTPSSVGQIYFSAAKAKEMAKSQSVILVQQDVPDDYSLLGLIKGLITVRGGTCSHPVIVLRQMGTAAIVGISDLIIDESAKTMTYNDKTLKEGDFVSIEGSTGKIYSAKLNLTTPILEKQNELKKIMSWADEIRSAKGQRKTVNGCTDRGLMVWANVDTVAELKKAREFGAEGVGICRTEHMLKDEAVKGIQELIFADDSATRDSCMAKVGDQLTNSLADMFKEAGDLPIVVRLLDPSITNYLPDHLALIDEVATMKEKIELGQKVDQNELDKKEKILEKVLQFTERNPMIGIRGIRMCIAYPSFMKMQLRAFIEAACIAAAKGTKPKPQIMVPFTCHENELIKIRAEFEEIKKEVFKQRGVDFPILFGTIIEVPRACLIADQLAEYSDFFSFGINDLSQMAFCYSRDDAESSFVQKYRDWGVLQTSPFISVDAEGIGKMMETAVADGRKVKKDLQIGACGEHGGNPQTIEFCHNIGIDYVSCNTYRILIAKLAAAQAVLKAKLM